MFVHEAYTPSILNLDIHCTIKIFINYNQAANILKRGERPGPRDSVLSLRPPGFESCGCRAVSYHSSHHPREVILAQFSLNVHTEYSSPVMCIKVA